MFKSNKYIAPQAIRGYARNVVRRTENNTVLKLGHDLQIK